MRYDLLNKALQSMIGEYIGEPDLLQITRAQALTVALTESAIGVAAAAQKYVDLN
jgi:hypothetical protein